MKNILVSLMFFVTSVLSPSAMVGDVDVTDNGVMRSEMTAFDYADDMGLGINLGNTMDAFWQDDNNLTSHSMIIDDGSVGNYERCWGAVTTTQECIYGMRDAGFDTVRIPVYWGNGMPDDRKFEIKKELLDRVGELIDYCRNADMYAVVNIHHYDEFIIKNYPRKEAVQIFKKLWKQIAERYKGYSDYVVFEGFNENLGSVYENDHLSPDEIYDYVNELNRTFVETVRSTGGNNSERLLIVSGYWTNVDMTCSESFVVPQDTIDDRIMVSVHYVDNEMYWSNKIGSDEWVKHNYSQCEKLKKAFTDKGIPVFFGETSSGYPYDRMAKGTTYNSSSALKKVLTTLTEYGFVPVIWDTNDDFYSRELCKIKDNSDAIVVREISNAMKP